MQRILLVLLPLLVAAASVRGFAVPPPPPPPPGPASSSSASHPPPPKYVGVELIRSNAHHHPNTLPRRHTHPHSFLRFKRLQNQFDLRGVALPPAHDKGNQEAVTLSPVEAYFLGQAFATWLRMQQVCGCGCGYSIDRGAPSAVCRQPSSIKRIHLVDRLNMGGPCLSLVMIHKHTQIYTQTPPSINRMTATTTTTMPNP